MAYAHRRAVFAVLAVVTTSALLIAGNGMEARWPLMWVAFVPVLLYAAMEQSALAAGTVAGVSFLLGSYPMLHYLTGSVHAPFYAWLLPFGVASVLFAMGVLLFRRLLRQGMPWSAVVALPALWACLEYAASFVPANGTAGNLAYTQLGFLPVLQLASVTGPWGISFVLLLFPSALVTGIVGWRGSQPRRSLAVAATTAAVLLAAVAWGMVRLRTPQPGERVRVGLLVTDAVDIAELGAQAHALLGKYAEQAERLAQRGAAMVVMPEKVAVVLDDVAAMDAMLQPVADRTGATLVVGVLHVYPEARRNEARIYQPGRAVATYAKEHMLPPFESNLEPGTSLTLLQGGRVGVAICKDMDFVRPARDYGRAGVGLMLDPAWDFQVDRVWHGHIAIMRGVENGYSLAHAAKDGLLTVTDDRGRVLGEARSGDAPFATLLVDVPTEHEETIFSQFGGWFAGLALLLLAGVGVRAMV